jgi:hypothetical protein
MTPTASPNGVQPVVTVARRSERSTLAAASTAIARAAQEIETLWRESIAANDPDVSERLAEVSHAVQRAGRVLNRGARVIG